MIGDFEAAAEEFEHALQYSGHSKVIRKKLIICHVQNNALNQALDLLISLVREDLEYTTKANPMEADCHSLELIGSIEQQFVIEKRDKQCLALAILWLFVNPLQSIRYFEFARMLMPKDDRIDEILSVLYQLTGTSTKTKQSQEVNTCKKQ